jgi:hypothetical protein
MKTRNEGLGKYISRVNIRGYEYFRVRVPAGNNKRIEKLFKTYDQALSYRYEMAKKYNLNLLTRIKRINRYEIRGSDTILFLNHKGKVLETVIDTSDLEKVKGYGVWCVVDKNCDGKKLYVGLNISKTKNGKRKQRKVYLHQVICPKPEGSNLVVDHINHDTFNNRRENLRLVTQAENMRNLSKKSNTGYSNIYKTVNGTYKVMIEKGGRTKRKTLKTLEDAIKWRNENTDYTEFLS